MNLTCLFLPQLLFQRRFSLVKAAEFVDLFLVLATDLDVFGSRLFFLREL